MTPPNSTVVDTPSHFHVWIHHWALRIPFCEVCGLDMPEETVAALRAEARRESWWPK